MGLREPRPTTQDVSNVVGSDAIRTPTPEGEKIQFTQPLEVFPQGEEPAPGPQEGAPSSPQLDSDGLPAMTDLENMARQPAGGLDADGLPSMKDLEAIASGGAPSGQEEPLPKQNLKKMLSTSPEAASFLVKAVQRAIIETAPNEKRAKEVAQFIFGKDRVSEVKGDLYVDGIQFNKDFWDSFSWKELPLDFVGFATNLGYSMASILPEIEGAAKGATIGSFAASPIPLFGPLLGSVVGGGIGAFGGVAAGTVLEDNIRNAVLSAITDEKLDVEIPEQLALRTAINLIGGKVVQKSVKAIMKGAKSFGRWISTKGIDKELFLDAFDELANNILHIKKKNLAAKGFDLEDATSTGFAKRFNSILEEEESTLGAIVTLYKNQADVFYKGERVPTRSFSNRLKETLENWGGVSFSQSGHADIVKVDPNYMAIDNGGSKLQKLLVDIYNSQFVENKSNDLVKNFSIPLQEFKGMTIDQIDFNLKLLNNKLESNLPKKVLAEMKSLYGFLSNERNRIIAYGIGVGERQGNKIAEPIAKDINKMSISTAVENAFSNYSKAATAVSAFKQTMMGRSENIKHAIATLVKRGGSEDLKALRKIVGEDSVEWQVFRAGWYTDLLEQSRSVQDFSGRVDIRHLVSKIYEQLDPDTMNLMIGKKELEALKIAGKILHKMAPENLQNSRIGRKAFWLGLNGPTMGKALNIAETSAMVAENVLKFGQVNAEYADYLANTGLSQLAAEANSLAEKNLIVRVVNILDAVLGADGARKVKIKHSVTGKAKEVAEKLGGEIKSKLPDADFEVYRFTGAAAALIDNLYTQDAFIQSGQYENNNSRIPDYSILNEPVK